MSNLRKHIHIYWTCPTCFLSFKHYTPGNCCCLQSFDLWLLGGGGGCWGHYNSFYFLLFYCSLFFGALLLSSQTNLVIGRLFKKIELSESIRYASGDPIESWLHALLCLDVTSSIPHISRLEHAF